MKYAVSAVRNVLRNLFCLFACSFVRSFPVFFLLSDKRGGYVRGGSGVADHGRRSGVAGEGPLVVVVLWLP